MSTSLSFSLPVFIDIDRDISGGIEKMRKINKLATMLEIANFLRAENFQLSTYQLTWHGTHPFNNNPFSVRKYPTRREVSPSSRQLHPPFHSILRIPRKSLRKFLSHFLSEFLVRHFHGTSSLLLGGLVKPLPINSSARPNRRGTKIKAPSTRVE